MLSIVAFSSILLAAILSSTDAYTTRFASKMMLGDMLKKTGLVKDQSFSVEFIKGSEVVTTQAKKGEKLSIVAENAGAEIKYKCKKGECGTCEVNIDGKWVKACQTTLSAPKEGNTLKVTLREIMVAKEKSAEFFSPKSFLDGVINNGLGVVGFVQVALKADDEFDARMKREAELAAKVEAARKAKGGK